MIPEFGQFALILALALALAGATVPLVGASLNKTVWMRLARPLTYGQAFFILISFICLSYSFLSNDFSVAYVTENSNSHLPWVYRLAAVWGAHEGSLLLWVSVLAVWSVLVARFSRQLPLDAIARVLAVMAMISVGFLLFMLTTSDPFTRLLPNFPVNGNDLNPLLQDPGLASHPPMLYMGYVGFSVAFAFAIAALISGKLDSSWARWTRPWTIAAWCFLTLGITLGSWWAYRVLGWGGWWFWDPVENASFMPWLTGTALIHCLAVTEKRGAFKSWTVLMAILAFSLSLIGTFLVRSGILTSVHAFAVDPKRGAYILHFLTIVVGGSLVLYVWRAAKLRSNIGFNLLSKESLLLSNNIILITAMATVLLGTMYPLLIQALGLGKLSVGPPYFNSVFVPMMVPLFVLMGIGPQADWRGDSARTLARRLLWVFIACAALAVILPMVFAHHETITVVFGLGLAFWIITTMLQTLFLQQKKLAHGMLGIPKSQYGMAIAHIGLAICVIGVTLSSSYSSAGNFKMAPGGVVQMGGYRYHFDSTQAITGSNYKGIAALFTVKKGQRVVANVVAEKRIFTVSQMPTTKPGIVRFFFRDLYLALGEPLDNNAWGVRIYDKPFVHWIWGGGFIMALGGFLALLDRRYYSGKKQSQERDS